MILGALPKENSSSYIGGTEEITDEEHYGYIREEHKAIVQEWIKVFGRLPPFPSPEPEPEPVEGGDDNAVLPFGDGFSPSSQSKFLPGQKDNDLTLVGNEDCNWDEVEDWDSLFP